MQPSYNSDLRRISALLLCQLFYNNLQLKLAFVKKLNIQPAEGRICINGLGQSVQKYPSTLKKCLQIMKNPIKKGEQNSLCWAINLDKKNLHLQYFQFKKYSSFTFLDPMRNIFGICIPVQNKKSISQPVEVPVTQSSIRSKLQTNPSSQVQITSKQKMNVNNSGIYGRKFNRQSQQKRPQTSRERQSKSKSNQKNFAFIKLKDFNFYKNQDKLKEAKKADKKQKLGNSIQSISQYARNSYGKTIDRQKNSISFSQAMDQIGDSYKQKTDRRLRERNIDLMTTDVKRSPIDNKYPQTTKNQHQNFYKRVQQILKK